MLVVFFMPLVRVFLMEIHREHPQAMDPVDGGPVS
jgi:hypothetical protein